MFALVANAVVPRGRGRRAGSRSGRSRCSPTPRTWRPTSSCSRSRTPRCASPSGRRPNATRSGSPAPRCSSRRRNGVLLFAGAIVVIVEAIRRFGSPHDVSAAGVIVVGAIGLVVNVASAAALFRHAHDNINMRGAFWHLFSDALGSIGVIVAGVGVALFGAEWLDPAIVDRRSRVLVIVGRVAAAARRGPRAPRSGARRTSTSPRCATRSRRKPASRPCTICTSGRRAASRPRCRRTSCSAARSACTTRSSAPAS